MEKDELKAAVKEGVEDAIGSFFIDRQQHYEDHTFVKDVRGGVKKVRTGGLLSLGAAFVAFIIYALQTWVASNTPAP